MKVDELSKKMIGPRQMDVKGAGAVFRGIIALILWLIAETRLNTKPSEQFQAFSSGSSGYWD
jgi:hypothetical protein